MTPATNAAERDEPTDSLPDWTGKVVLAYGPRKSGTTLLLNLLDGGDEMFAYPTEITSKRLLETEWSQDAVGRFRAVVRTSELERAGVEMSAYHDLWDQVDPDAMTNDPASLVRSDVHNIAQTISPPPAPSMWCAKDAGGRAADNIALWRQLFKQPKFIFIVRNPAMVVRAVLMDRRRHGIRLTWRQVITQTVDPIRVIKAQVEMLADTDTAFVAYEDLVADTPGEMRKLAAFIGVPYGPHFEEPTAFGKPIIVKTSSRQVNKVFNDNAGRYSGLTLREKFLVAATYVVLKFMPEYHLDYGQLRRQIAARQI